MESLAPNTPANADNTALVNAPEADAGGAEANGDGSAPSAPEAGTPAPKKDAVQERIDKLTREKYDNARLADQRGYELEREKAERERLTQELAELKKAQTSQVAPDTFPTLESVGYDEAKFAAAIVAYNKATTESAKAAAREEAQAIIRAEREAQTAEQANKSWATKEAEFLKSKPDYAEKVIEGGRRGAWACTPEMAQIMKQSDLGPAIAYHLAENAEKAQLIANLPPLAQAREIGRIEARIEAAKANPPAAVSKAPPPPVKVDEAESGTTLDLMADADKISDAEWARRRNAQERAKLRKQRG